LERKGTAVIVRSCATFTTDLPDDQIENEEGSEIVQYGGKSVAEAISEILTRLGCVVKPPRYADEHGWELDLKFGKRSLWCQVTLIGSYVIYFEEISWVNELLGRHHPLYLDILTRLAQELGHDARFNDVLWFLRDEVLTGVAGSKEPISAN
jgi:hypothetical protein